MELKDYLDFDGLSRFFSHLPNIFADKTETNKSISDLNTLLDSKGEVKTINALSPDEDGNVHVTAESIGAVPDDVDIVTFSVVGETLVIGNATLANAEGAEF